MKLIVGIIALLAMLAAPAMYAADTEKPKEGVTKAAEGEKKADSKDNTDGKKKEDGEEEEPDCD
jgi:hypothetical protein